MKRTEFLVDITDDDVLDVWLDVVSGRVVGFCVNYRAWLDGGWLEVIRYDTAHGKLHAHEFWPRGQERLVPVRRAGGDYTLALKDAMQDIRRNWPAYRAKMEPRP